MTIPLWVAFLLTVGGGLVGGVVGGMALLIYASCAVSGECSRVEEQERWRATLRADGEGRQ